MMFLYLGQKKEGVRKVSFRVNCNGAVTRACESANQC